VQILAPPAVEAIGAHFGLIGMGKAAWSLCELLDLLEVDLPSGRPAVDTHVRSLQILRSGALLPKAERRALLAGLSSLLAHVRTESARRSTPTAFASAPAAGAPPQPCSEPRRARRPVPR
jgi:hypothetical protein